MDVLSERARAEEVDAAAEVWLKSRKASVPVVPAPVHSDHVVRAWFEHRVFPEQELWLAKSGGIVVAVLVLDCEWIGQLYVAPARVGRGVGGRLVTVAKEQRPDGLKLWTFTANVRARQFYERHGFVPVGIATSENEEQTPALRYEWMPSSDSISR